MALSLAIISFTQLFYLSIVPMSGSFMLRKKIKYSNIWMSNCNQVDFA